jgi:hypothetical protein
MHKSSAHGRRTAEFLHEGVRVLETCMWCSAIHYITANMIQGTKQPLESDMDLLSHYKKPSRNASGD